MKTDREMLQYVCRVLGKLNPSDFANQETDDVLYALYTDVDEFLDGTAWERLVERQKKNREEYLNNSK